MVEEGVTVVVSTSYMEEAERFDRVALLDEGRIIALDTPSHLEEALEGRLFHVQAEELRDTRDRLRDAPGVTGATLFGNRIHVLLAQPDPAAATRLAAIAGVDESAIEPKSAGLEDVFLSQVGSSA